MGKIIKNSDGSKTRISSSGRKFTYKSYKSGGETEYKWSDSNTKDNIGIINSQRSGEQTIKTRFADDEPLMIKPWENMNKIAQGDMTKAATGKVEESLSPLDLIGTGVLKGAANLGSKALSNTYKINPWAFKPSQGMLYRGIGKEGMEDALQSGVFRANQNIPSDMVGRFDMAKRFKGVYYSPKFNVADDYGKGFIAEVPETAGSFANRYARGKDWSKVTRDQIPIEKGKILQKHWLQGYKEVPQKSFGNGGEIVLHGQTEPEQLDNLKWPKGYIEDPARRAQHVKDTYFNLLDSKVLPSQAYEMMNSMSGYGSQRGGIAATQGATWGFDHKDINQDKLDKLTNEYTKLRNKSYKNAGRIRKSC